MVGVWSRASCSVFPPDCCGMCYHVAGPPIDQLDVKKMCLGVQKVYGFLHVCIT